MSNLSKEAIITILQNSGWTLDRWGHLQKTLSVRGVHKDYRIKMQATSLRVEVKVHYPADDYSKARNEWIRVGGEYYSKIQLDAGKLRIGRHLLKVTS